MKEVTSIKNIGVDDESVEMLEELLAEAKSGELKQLVYIHKNKEGEIGHGWAGAPDLSMIGGLEDTKFEILLQYRSPVIDE